ncbi:MAG: prepilin peptidase [Proteobacteria bacterium]|nr:prepilin peptidase [Pseudomonadota bacterium]
MFLTGLLGLIWGSFFNVCILRLPENQTVIWDRSHCPQCKNVLRWYHNIPLFSFLFLRGRCAFCKQSISWQYPAVELITALLFVLLWLEFNWSWQWLFYTVFASSLLIITVIDIHHMIIPDEISLPGILVGFVALFFTHDILWWESLLGAAFGGGVFLLIAYLYEKFAKQEGLGGGDVKLLAMIGAWLGYRSVLTVIVVSSTLGSLAGLSVMAIKKKNFKTAIPFGPFLAVAALIYLILGNQINRLLLLDLSD